MAGRDDFAAISKLLIRWREEEAELVERLEHRGRELEPLPEALRVLARLSEIPGNLAKADRAKLALAIRQTVSSITIGVRDAKSGEIEYRELHGELAFHEAFGQRPIAIPDEVIGQRRVWREIGALARKSKKPIHLADVCTLIDSPDPAHACYHMRQAVRAGLVRKVGAKDGWVAKR